MDEAISRFRSAALDFRAAFDGADDARRLRNAVARVYLAAAFLPAAGSGPAPAGAAGAPEPSPAPPGSTDDVSRALGELDEALERALVLLGRGTPEDVRRVRFEFEQGWSHHALAVFRPLHRLATGR